MTAAICRDMVGPRRYRDEVRWHPLFCLCLLLAACASQRPVKRRDFMVTFGGVGGALKYSEPCDQCDAAPSAAFDLRVGHVLGESGRAALFVDLSIGEAWPEPRRVVHGFVGGGLVIWPHRRVFAAASLGANGTGTETEEDEWGGLAGRLIGGVTLAEWRGATIDLWLDATFAQYFEGDGMDLGVGLGWSTFFDFDFKKGADPAQQAAPPATH
jgi:hypothetical protein